MMPTIDSLPSLGTRAVEWRDASLRKRMFCELCLLQNVVAPATAHGSEPGNPIK